MNSQATTSKMRFAVGLSTNPDSAAAVEDVCAQVASQLDAKPDLALIFISPHHGDDLRQIAAKVVDRTAAAHLIGCTGESVVAGDREVERQPAIALWLASMPGVSVETAHLERFPTPQGDDVSGWPQPLLGDWPDGASLIALGEPYSFPINVLLEQFNHQHGGVPIIGGMASGGSRPGENHLLLDGEQFDEGAVVARLHGPLRLTTVVSQGCRPIGEHFIITKARENIILELGGRSPMDRLREVFEELSEHEQDLVQHSLHVGKVIDEYRDSFDRGDFLVRSCLGHDPESGAIAVGDSVRVGQTIQFHVRDADSADDDLRTLLADGVAENARAALLFTCNGRGTRLFDEPDHDTSIIRELTGDIPVAGFFAQGELGPIGGRNFIHGFTASVALFQPEE